MLQIKAYPKTTAVLVRNHGIYVWGDSWISAKTQVSMLYFLCQYYTTKKDAPLSNTSIRQRFVFLTRNFLFQSECYHYLFDAAIKLHQLGLDWSTPFHGPIHHQLINAKAFANGGTLSSTGGIGQSRVDFQ